MKQTFSLLSWIHSKTTHKTHLLNIQCQVEEASGCPWARHFNAVQVQMAGSGGCESTQQEFANKSCYLLTNGRWAMQIPVARLLCWQDWHYVTPRDALSTHLHIHINIHHGRDYTVCVCDIPDIDWLVVSQAGSTCLSRRSCSSSAVFVNVFLFAYTFCTKWIVMVDWLPDWVCHCV